MLFSMQILNDPSKEPSQRTNIGYLMLGLTAFLIISNIIIIGTFIVIDIKSSCRRKYRELSAKKSNEKRKEMQDLKLHQLNESSSHLNDISSVLLTEIKEQEDDDEADEAFE